MWICQLYRRTEKITIVHRYTHCQRSTDMTCVDELIYPDQKEVEIQCVSSTESVISSSASPVQIQCRIQWENSVRGVLVQCTLLQTYRSTEGHLAVVGQCQASREAVYNQCPISMSVYQ